MVWTCQQTDRYIGKRYPAGKCGRRQERKTAVAIKITDWTGKNMLEVWQAWRLTDVNWEKLWQHHQWCLYKIRRRTCPVETEVLWLGPTDRSREPRSAGFATADADLFKYFMPKLAKMTGHHLGFRFDDLRRFNPLEIGAILAITIWSINPRKMSTRPPGWSGRTNHSPDGI